LNGSSDDSQRSFIHFFFSKNPLQDDGWGDNATALTGNTSVASGSMDDVSRLGGGDGGRGVGDGGPNDPAWSSNAMGQFQSHSNLGWNFKCQRYLGSITAAVLAVLAVMTPVAMVLLPRMQIVPLRSEQLRCPAECEGLLITLTVKLVLLILGSWAVFWRPTRATMPRIFFLRTLVLLLVFVTTFAYCLFYGVRVVEQQDQLDYKVSHPKKFEFPNLCPCCSIFKLLLYNRPL
jgi:vang-like